MGRLTALAAAVTVGGVSLMAVASGSPAGACSIAAPGERVTVDEVVSDDATPLAREPGWSSGEWAQGGSEVGSRAVTFEATVEALVGGERQIGGTAFGAVQDVDVRVRRVTEGGAHEHERIAISLTFCGQRSVGAVPAVGSTVWFSGARQGDGSIQGSVVEAPTGYAAATMSAPIPGRGPSVPSWSAAMIPWLGPIALVVVGGGFWLGSQRRRQQTRG